MSALFLRLQNAAKRWLYSHFIIKINKSNMVKCTDDSRLVILLINLGIIHKFVANRLSFSNLFPNSKRKLLLIKVQQIESLAQPEIITSGDMLVEYFQGNTSLIFDLSTEAITFSEYPADVLKKFHNNLRSAEIDAKDVILLCANAVAGKHYSQWAKNNGFNNYQIKMIGYDFYFYEYFWEISKCKWLKEHKSELLLDGQKTCYEGKKRGKHFLCLNLRPRWHRTAIVLHLLERNHINKGYLTYFGKEFADHHSVSTTEETIANISQLPSSERLLPHLESLYSMSPLTLDRDADTMRKDLWQRLPGQVEFLFPDIEANPTGTIDSYFEIVTETWFTDSSASYITEKTLRPILRLQPFIHVGTPHLLAKLRQKGFKTFAPYINEEYDSIENCSERLEAIFKEIDRLCAMSLDEIHELYCKLWPTLVFNFNHYLNNALKHANDDIGINIINKLIAYEEHDLIPVAS